MATFDVVNLKRVKVSEIELADEVFRAIPNRNNIYEAVKAQQVSRRAGTVAVKNSSLVSGGGKKPWKQKGTGKARQGSNRASQWVGGGKAMGPKPRDYQYRPPRTVRRGGLRSALSLRAGENAIVILDAFPSDGKTAHAVQALTEGLGLKSALVIDERANLQVLRAVRNLADFDALPVEGLNVESVLRRKSLVLTVAAARAINDAMVHSGKRAQASA